MEANRNPTTDSEREAAMAVFDEIGEAFADQSPERIDEEVARAIAEVRAERAGQQESRPDQ